MLKKVAYAVVAGGLVLAAQAVSADDTQFEIGPGQYQGVAALPFRSFGSGVVVSGGAETPRAAPQRLESTHAGAVATQSVPAPYNVPGGYFN